MSIELIISLISTAVAIASAIYSFTTRRKLDKQVIKLNEFKLKEEKEKEESSHKALIDISIDSLGKGSYDVQLSNVGKSDARNIRFEELSENKGFNLMVSPELFPFGVLMPNKTINIRAFATIGRTNALSVKVIWDDNSGDNKERILNVPIP